MLKYLDLLQAEGIARRKLIERDRRTVTRELQRAGGGQPIVRSWHRLGMKDPKVIADSSKGKGKGKGKDQAHQEICFRWAKGIGPCAGLLAGADCKGLR